MNDPSNINRHINTYTDAYWKINSYKIYRHVYNVCTIHINWLQSKLSIMTSNWSTCVSY